MQLLPTMWYVFPKEKIYDMAKSQYLIPHKNWCDIWNDLLLSPNYFLQ